jgi:hypothetical protein
MKKPLLVLAAALALAGCRSWSRATGDIEVAITEEERSLEVDSGRTTLRILNRGACPVEVRHGEETYLLKTSQDKELVLEGSHVLHFKRRGDGEGMLEVHFQSEGRRNFVHLK